MSKETFSSSDGEDTLIDQLFEDIGYKPRAESLNGRLLGDTASSESDPKGRNGSERTRRNRPSSILELPLKIPSIFLTEGEKNRRILKQDKVISRQLDEEHEKNRNRRATLETAKQQILSELNDNGSDYMFSWKNDFTIVEEYMQKNLSKDVSMVTQRQFYFFNNVEQPQVDDKLVHASSSLSTVMRHLSSDADQVLSYLRSGQISISAFLVTSLVDVCDLASLTCVEKIMKRFSALAKGKDPSETIDNARTFLCLMRTIGARPVEISSTSTRVELRLVHYNNHTNLLVLRLSIIFNYYLPCATSKTELMHLFHHFYLSCSDFHLNNLEKESLRKVFVRPVFELFINKWTSDFGSDGFIDAAHAVFALISPTVYGEEEVQPQKAFEVHFSMLSNLLHLLSPDNIVVRKLVFMFLGVRELEGDLAALEKVIEDMGKLVVARKLCKNDVYENFFKAQLTSTLLTYHALSEPHHKTDALLACYEKLLECKDTYQLVIGHISFSLDENTLDKARITLYLSDTYDTLDHIASVLSKSGVLPNRDFLYGKESDMVGIS